MSSDNNHSLMMMIRQRADLVFGPTLLLILAGAVLLVATHIARAVTGLPLAFLPAFKPDAMGLIALAAIIFVTKN